MEQCNSFETSHLSSPGLYYFNARCYDPDMGRFITEDPIKDGNNWYAYCRNNPYSYTDPTGLLTTSQGMAKSGYDGNGNYNARNDSYRSGPLDGKGFQAIPYEAQKDMDAFAEIQESGR